jgi:hypothetical protein
MLRMSDSVEGGPGQPQQRAARDEHLGARGKGGEHRCHPEGGGANHEQTAATDPVPERAHGDQRTRDQEPVDVNDPQELRGARVEIRAEPRHGQVQDGQIHRIQHAGQRDHGEPDPFAASRSGWWTSIHERHGTVTHVIACLDESIVYGEDIGAAIHTDECARHRAPPRRDAVARGAAGLRVRRASVGGMISSRRLVP